MSISERISRFIVETETGLMPPEAFAMATKCFIDCTGVLLAGSVQTESRIVAGLVKGWSGILEAGVFGQGFRAPAPFAALANGVAAHALDFDDVSTTFLAHPSVNLVPTLFALAEKRNASGRDVLTAYILGYEVGAYLGAAMGMEFFGRGWHATSVLGTVAAAASAARLLSLNVEQTIMALGTAASGAAGLKINFGSMTKPLHVGHAAQWGIMAALLAKSGLTANGNVFDGINGFCTTYKGSECDLNSIERQLGSVWYIVDPGVKFKLYPCCGSIHGCIDAALELKRRHNISQEDVEKIECTLSPLMVETGASIGFPKTGQEGRFSLPFNMAMCITDGELTLEQFADERVRSSRVRDLMEKVKISCPEEMARGMEEPQEVSLLLKNGVMYKQRVEKHRGTQENPISDTELFTKFRNCAGTVLDAHLVEEVFHLLDQMNRLENLSRLGEALIFAT